MERAYWVAKDEGLTISTRAFIGGREVDAESGATFETINPATGQVIARIAECGAADVDRAVKAARKAFDSGSWSRMAPAERKKRLVRFGDLVEKHSEELALLETLDMGKPIRDSLSIDMPLSATCLRWYGEAIDKLYDEIAPTAPSALALIRRVPVGVVAAIVPWNFPLLMAVWKIAPVLAAGNSIILKPAEQSPLTALRIAQLSVEAGIPEGVFNVVPGFGETAGRALGLHMDVDAVTFTGSTEVGKLFMTYSGQSNLKRVSMECGGKSPHIVLADAPDLEAAATAAAWGAFFNQGQNCCAGTRLIVEDSIREDFVARVIDIGRQIKMGDPLDPATQLGPLVDTRQAVRVKDYIRKGEDEGARLVLGGGESPEGQNFVAPTVFEDVSNAMTIAQEEIFGPVLSVISVKNLEEAIAIGNDSNYGLAGGIWTSDINKALKASDGVRSGIIWVNCYDTGDITVPFGGFKQTGFGRDKSLHAIDKYTDLKTIWISTNS